MSLSARRAWIEISMSGLLLRRSIVALRKESVDRNSEISSTFHFITVALRKESVDRNKVAAMIKSSIVSRSPQGERG